jgi:archaellum component FlaC
MRTLIIYTISVLLSISVNAQIDSAQVEQRFDQIEQQFQELKKNYEATQRELQELRSRDNLIQKSINGLSNRSEKLSYQIDSLRILLQANSNAVSNINQQLIEQKKELAGKISETRETTSKSVSELDRALSKNTLYWIISVLAVGMLSILAFVFLRKKVTENQSSINERLANTRKELEQEAIRLDEKLVGVMETQMKIIQEERKAQPESENDKQDHSLALKVADEIVRIEKNLSKMDENTKGLKQLTKAVQRIKDNFAASGYEMVELLNKPYNEGLKVYASFIPDENLEPDQSIITRIIKPQVKYQGEMIQPGQVEVSQPPK